MNISDNGLKMVLFLFYMLFGCCCPATADGVPDGIIEVEKTGGDLPS